ncbi:MAG: MFS transporter [Deltaproteobacteria bacterium]|nr:MFS transporter [Deltaproteobacteria bacterium]
MNGPATPYEARRARLNIKLYYAYVFLGNVAFWISIHVVYFQARGLSFTEIMWLLFAQSACQVLLEVPSGVLSDRFGRRRTLTISAALKVAFCVLCMLDASVVVYLVGACLLGAHIAFESGTDAALIYESLGILDRQDDYTKVKGRGFSLRMAGNGIGAIGGGLLASVDYLLPWLVAGVCCLMALVVSLLLFEPRRVGGHQDLSAREIVAFGLRSLRDSRRLTLLVLLSGTVISTLLVGLRYQQPYLAQAGIALEGFGPVYLLWLLVSAGTSMTLGRWGPKVDERLLMFGLPALLMVQYLLLSSFVGTVGIAIMVLGQVVVGIARPMFTTYINREVGDTARATVLSVNGFAQNLLLLVLAPVVGFISDEWTIAAAFAGLAVVVSVAGWSLAALLSRVPAASATQPSRP